MSEPVVTHPPTDEELQRLYWELSKRGAPSVGRKAPWPYSPQSMEALLALAGDMLRYDPRLLSILLAWVLTHWHELNPWALRQEMQRMRWPQALLVLFEFARLGDGDRELRHSIDYISAGWDPVDPPETFFFDAERPGSRMATRKAGRNLRPYRRWGFVASERPTSNVFTKQTLGAFDPTTRRRIRRELARSETAFSLSDYLGALDDSISRQQAYHDLKSDKTLRLIGRGRGAQWRASS